MKASKIMSLRDRLQKKDVALTDTVQELKIKDLEINQLKKQLYDANALISQQKFSEAVEINKVQTQLSDAKTSVNQLSIEKSNLETKYSSTITAKDHALEKAYMRQDYLMKECQNAKLQIDNLKENTERLNAEKSELSDSLDSAAQSKHDA